MKSLLQYMKDNEINSSQIESIGEMKKILNDSHYIDIIIRHNGMDKRFEGDFLKYILRDLK